MTGAPVLIRASACRLPGHRHPRRTTNRRRHRGHARRRRGGPESHGVRTVRTQPIEGPTSGWKQALNALSTVLEVVSQNTPVRQNLVRDNATNGRAAHLARQKRREVQVGLSESPDWIMSWLNTCEAISTTDGMSSSAR